MHSKTSKGGLLLAALPLLLSLQACSSGSSGSGGAGATMVQGSVQGASSSGQGLRILNGGNVVAQLVLSNGVSLSAAVDPRSGGFTIPVSNIAGLNGVISVSQDGRAIFELIQPNFTGGASFQVGTVGSQSTANAQFIRGLARAQGIPATGTNFVRQLNQIPNVANVIAGLSNAAGPIASLVKQFLDQISGSNFGCSLADIQAGTCQVEAFKTLRENIVTAILNNLPTLQNFPVPQGPLNGGGTTGGGTTGGGTTGGGTTGGGTTGGGSTGGGTGGAGFGLATPNFQNTGSGVPSGAYPKVTDGGAFVFLGGVRDSVLVADDNDGEADCFVRDTQAGTTDRVSAGKMDDQDCAGIGDISNDGRWVVFQLNTAPDPTPTNQFPEIDRSDVYLFDRMTRQATLVSKTTGGDPAEGDSHAPRISDDGRFVVFHSEASDFVPDDTNGQPDIVRWDRINDTYEIATRAPDGSQMAFASRTNSSGTFAQLDFEADISSNGQVVVFSAEIQPGGDAPVGKQVFLRDFGTGTSAATTILASPGPDGMGLNEQDLGAGRPKVSGDGQTVVFQHAEALDPTRDTDNGQFDVYRFDRTSTSSPITMVSTGAFLSEVPGGEGTIKNDGFAGPQDINNTGDLIVFQASRESTSFNNNIFVYRHSTGTLQHASAIQDLPNGLGTSGGDSPHMSPNGDTIVFMSSEKYNTLDDGTGFGHFDAYFRPNPLGGSQ